jgi:hypothetical protein
MTASKVFFSDLRASLKENLLAKCLRLMDQTGIKDIIAPRDLVALKLHFGEKGNTAFIRPVFIRQIVERVKELRGVPFLTDANTLYAGTRGNGVSHIHTAIANGFAYSVLGAPIIIADGLRGASFSEIPIGQTLIKTAYIGKEIAEADALVSIAHFKGHELSGFGGTLKNLGMGCASRRGKLDQHSDLCPKVKAKKCVGCGDCVAHCAQGAISLINNKARINAEQCIGCGECILICPNGAIEIQWSADIEAFQKKMAEYTLGVLKGKQGKALFINFLTDVSPACDCYGYCDAPIVQDIGILCSLDPVAIDQAAADLVNQRVAAEGSCLAGGPGAGKDKFRGIYPRVDWTVQLSHAEAIGLGRRHYELVAI